MFTIGKLAGLAEVTTDTLRFCEREGLLAATGKTEGGYRLYDAPSVGRVRFIQQAQQCGITLAEIRERLTLRQRAVEQKLQLEAKIGARRTMSRALDGLITDCGPVTGRVPGCTILAALGGSMLPAQ